MNIRLQHTFYDLAGQAWTVQILDSDFSGSAITCEVASESLSINYEGSGDGRESLVKSSSATITLINQNGELDLFITDIINSLEQRFFIKILKGSSTYWVGLLLQDLITIPLINYPYEVQLQFSDGIAVLQNIKYDNSGVLYEGRDSFLTHIINIINKTGLLQLYSSSDTLVISGVNIFAVNHSLTSTISTLKYTDVDHRAFQTIDDSDNSYTAITCLEALELICKTFMISFFQANGKFNAISITALSSSFPLHRYTKFSELQSYELFSPDMSSVFKMLNGALMRFLPPLLYVKSTYKHRLSINPSNLLPVQNYYSTLDYVINVENEPDISLDKFNFAGKVDYSGIQSGYTNQTLRAVFGFVVKLVSSTGSIYYMRNLNGLISNSTAEWLQTATQTYYYVTAPISTAAAAFSGTANFSWASPEFPVDAEAYFMFEFIRYERYTNGIWATIYIPGPPNFYFSWACNNFVLQIQRLLYPFINTTGGERTFKLTQIVPSSSPVTPVKASKEIDFGEINIGDGPQTYSIGGIKVSSDGVNWDFPGGWSRRPIGVSSNSIDELRLKEFMIGQLRPTKMLSGSLYVTGWDALKVLIIDDVKYAFKSGTFTIESCTLECELIEQVYSTNLYSNMNMTVTNKYDLIDPPSTSGNNNSSYSASPAGTFGVNSNSSTLLSDNLINILSQLAVTFTTSAINTDVEYSSVNVDTLTSVYFKKDDVITIWDVNSGAFESFKVKEDQSISDTSIQIEDQYFENNYNQGSLIIVKPSSIKSNLEKVPMISFATAAPTSKPTKPGDIYIDTLHKKIYMAKDIESSSDWQSLN